MDKNKNLTIKMYSRKNGEYYLGKLDSPGYLDARKGIVFLFFNSIKNNEELQVALPDSDKNRLSKPRISNTKGTDKNLSVPMFDRTDAQGRIYYVATLEYNGFIDLERCQFMAWTSLEGKEKLQITCNLEHTLVASDDNEDDPSSSEDEDDEEEDFDDSEEAA